MDTLWVPTEWPPALQPSSHSQHIFQGVLVSHTLTPPHALSDVLLAADHVSHLENVSEDEINRLLGMVVDVENLFMSVHKEEDTDTKQVYFYLFKVSKCVSNTPVSA